MAAQLFQAHWEKEAASFWQGSPKPEAPMLLMPPSVGTAMILLWQDVCLVTLSLWQSWKTGLQKRVCRPCVSVYQMETALTSLHCEKKCLNISNNNKNSTMKIDVIFVLKYLLQSSPDVYYSAPISLHFT